MRRGILVLTCLMTIVGALGCARFEPDAGHGDIRDAMFGRRANGVGSGVHQDSLLHLAREITVIEDDLRRDGTITVKAPDVWGDANLMSYIQEYESLLAESVKSFEETLQAYIARSDAMELQSTTSLGAALGMSANGVPVPESMKVERVVAASSSSSTSSAPDKRTTESERSNEDKTTSTTEGAATPDQPEAKPIALEDYKAFELIKNAVAAAKPTGESIGVEPTELERQRSVFIHVNQALRRRNMGDDSSRAAGYGLYMFRVPVSILPGRETREGHSAVVTLRAQLRVDAVHLRNTFPKLVVADLVEILSKPILDEWGKPIPSTKEELVKCLKMAIASAVELLTLHKTSASAELIANLNRLSMELDSSSPAVSMEQARLVLTDLNLTHETQSALLPKADTQAKIDLRQAILNALGEVHKFLCALIASSRAAESVPVIGFEPLDQIYGRITVAHLREAAEAELGGRPSLLELRSFLFRYLSQVYLAAQERKLLEHDSFLTLQMQEVKKGCVITNEGVPPAGWFECIPLCEPNCNTPTERRFRHVSWLVAIQAALLDNNLKRILKDLDRKHKLSQEDVALIEAVYFYNPDKYPQTAVLWQRLIQETFPVHVFSLDPQVEEQNVYDAFSRRREMQLALAFNVANGRFNLGQRLALSRQLALDMADIDLNRTAVAFSHGADTFGWYFYPRVQSPPTESTNLGALARMIWSTGPTERYDLRHRALEPGMRECEVLIAMPSFVNEIAFDVTTNWERLAKAGVTKRSYEEMIAQGGRIHRLRTCLREVTDQECYRPGDYERLLSRIDQLEQMLGLQTYTVNIPYEYEHTGTDLFDNGNVHLRPVVSSYYGLDFLQQEKDEFAFFFLTGKNFHPTQTHVVVGGFESHAVKAMPEANSSKVEVEVISRELIRVKVGKLSSALSRDGAFQVRVATPAGVSNVLTIGAKPAASTAGALIDFKNQPKIIGVVCLADPKTVNFHFQPFGNLELESKVGKVAKHTKLYIELTVTLPGGQTLTPIFTDPVKVETVDGKQFFIPVDVEREIKKKLVEKIKSTSEPEATVTGIGYLVFPDGATMRLAKSILIEIKRTTIPGCIHCQEAKPAGDNALLQPPSVPQLDQSNSWPPPSPVPSLSPPATETSELPAEPQNSLRPLIRPLE